MDSVQELVHNKVLRFHDSIKAFWSVKKVLLYGSYAKGQAKEDSDIDVAVVIDEADHTKRVEITRGLFHMAFGIDAAIEPKCIFWDEYQHPDPASILSEIINTGIEVAGF